MAGGISVLQYGGEDESIVREGCRKWMKFHVSNEEIVAEQKEFAVW